MRHSFICLEENKVKYSQYWDYIPCENGIDFRDDFMRYINDTFAWIPSIHLCGMQYKHSSGLYLDGCTIINEEGALLFHNAITAWIQLFSTAPEAFQLTGPVLVDADNQCTGDFYKLSVDRDRLLDNLTVLSETAQKVSHGQHYLLHIGL